MNRRRFLGWGAGAVAATGAGFASGLGGTRVLAEDGDTPDGLTLDNLVGPGGPLARAHEFLLVMTHCALAQDKLGKGQTVNGIAIPDGLGLVAASGVLDSGFGFSYLPNLHIGATSWALIAAHRDNPFHLQQGQ